MTLTRFAAAVLIATLATTSAPADAQQRYSYEGYTALEAAMSTADDLRAGTTAGSAERTDATRIAISSRLAILGYLDGWLASGTMDSTVQAGAADARILLHQNLVRLYSEIGDCPAAARSLDAIAPLASATDAGLSGAYTAATTDYDRCVASSAAAPPDLTDPFAEAPDAAALRDRSGRRIAGLAMVGAGAAAFVVGAAWNFTLLDDRAEHRRDNGCVEPDCSERVAELGDRLDGARAPIAVLVAGGLTAATVGVVLAATGHEETVVVSVAPSRATVAVDLARLRRVNR
ncbi:MAG: hypothetical protein H6698_07710 [Myxococcales bacterium]|nr:hypothetical protein [Myxococcales bacterium]MCB9530160.1 hypothetical protein [Myxococcales bacterium]MCB9534174.1 hypothetical protein [Myxococcales bacterium]